MVTLFQSFSLFFCKFRREPKNTARMPAVGGIPTGPGKEYPGNLTPYVLVTCVVAAMGGLIFGYDIGISGNYTRTPYFCISVVS